MATQDEAASDEVPSDNDPASGRKSINNSRVSERLNTKFTSPGEFYNEYLEAIFCEEMHEMQLLCKNQTEVDETCPVFCTLCNDEIDEVLGYYVCKECEVDQEYCKDCAHFRGKLENDMAENPAHIETPHYEL